MLEATIVENFFSRSISLPKTKLNCARGRGTNLSAMDISFEGPEIVASLMGDRILIHEHIN